MAVASASALQWIPYAEAVCAVLGLVGASHEDLRCRAQQLSRSLSGAAGKPFAAGGVRFPEGGLYVCADLPPLGPALQAAQRAIMQVVVKDASHDACYWYYDTVGELMRLLPSDEGPGPAVFNPEKIESLFALEWVETGRCCDS